jgi:hypothetical protein
VDTVDVIQHLLQFSRVVCVGDPTALHQTKSQVICGTFELCIDLFVDDSACKKLVQPYGILLCALTMFHAYQVLDTLVGVVSLIASHHDTASRHTASCNTGIWNVS